MCVMCASKEIRAILIICFESITRKQRNNACDVAIIRTYVFN